MYWFNSPRCQTLGGVVQYLTFSELVSRVQQGDAEAFSQLLDEYGDAIQREIRFTLIDLRLRRFVGDSDVYQSVAYRLFVGFRDGRFDVETPKELINLLKGIARTRIAELVRFWHAQRRDLSLNTALPENCDVNHRSPTPEAIVEHSEWFDKVSQALSQRDRQIVDWQDEGLSWVDIAQRLGAASHEALRKQHGRALAKVSSQFAS